MNQIREINQGQLVQLLTTESPDILTLDFLSTRTQSPQVKEMWQVLVASRRQHYDWLKSFYTTISGKGATVDQVTFSRPATYQEGIVEQINEYHQRLRRLMNLLNEANSDFEQQYLRTLIYYFEREGYILNQIQQLER
ncbi:hypothetical protein [Alkalihalobacillus pseudalcaliphilus]|uniref:hypothetical protein n=1 Tax=Alkalihalobacillus pseudalcaliphilus TaxID=79884 RepID=UPI00064D7C83|nr:hypothetical protein [Alkalihalobacillus pseudalcaliphilus]KMK75000.1 hypothetical protein AB990_16145 [Alkalihalobacillus pseudalcaliphilus]